jgi:hypothetical protein
MSKFPLEIWHRIFIQLDLHERIKCTLVCQSWWQILDKYSLLCNVELIHNQDQFIDFMDMIERFPHRANQVLELKLDSCLGPSFNKRTLLNIFPNVRVLEVEWNLHMPDNSGDYKYFRKPIEMINSTPKIKVLHDSIFCELASQMLVSNLDGRLEELQLDFQGLNGIYIRAVQDQLKDLPVLKTIVLQNFYFGINDLENIHTNIPTIQNLILNCVSVAASEIPTSIIPATCIITLNVRIDWIVDVDTHIQLYHYMRKEISALTLSDFLITCYFSVKLLI